MNYTNAELIHMVDNDPNATPRERELVARMDELQTEIAMLQHIGEENNRLQDKVYEIETTSEEMENE